MKRIIQVMLIVFWVSCKAQTPLLSLYDDQYGKVAGAYYRDAFNDLNNFEGTWQLVNGTTTLKIVLQKKIQYYNDFSDLYTDMLIGEYQYIYNGVEKVNTLNLITTPPEDLYGHTIEGNIIIGNNNVPICPECNVNEKRVSLSFSEPTRTAVDGLSGEIIIRRVDADNVQKIKV